MMANKNPGSKDERRTAAKRVLSKEKMCAKKQQEDSRGGKGGLLEVFLHPAVVLHEMRENR